MERVFPADAKARHRFERVRTWSNKYRAVQPKRQPDRSVPAGGEVKRMKRRGVSLRRTTQERAAGIVGRVRAALEERLKSLDWLEGPTREKCAIAPTPTHALPPAP